MIRRTWKQYTALFLCVLFLIPWFFQTADATGYDRHGYTLLENDAQRYAYEKLAAGINNSADHIQLDDQKKVTVNDLSTAMEMVYADYPEYFWINGAYSYSRINGSECVTRVEPVYTFTGTDLQTAKSKLEAAVSSLIASIPTSARSDYDKSLFLHNQLASLVPYQSTSNDQTAYGALVEKKCIAARLL